MPNMFQNFLAGREVANNERQNQLQNQLLLGNQQIDQQQVALKQAAAQNEAGFNQAAVDYLGPQTVNILGLPRRAPQSPQQQPYGLPTGDAGTFSADPQQQESEIFSRLVARDPKRALELQAERQKRTQAMHQQIYGLANKTLTSKSPSATFKYLLQSDKIGDLDMKGFREQLTQNGIDPETLDDDQTRDLLQNIATQSAIAGGVQPQTDDLKEYEVARSQGETRNFSDWLASIKRSGAPSTNVNLPGYEKAFSAKLAEGDAKRIEKYQQQADGALSLRDTISQLADLNETALQGGTADARLEVANWIQGLTGIDTIDPKVLADTQQYNSLINKAVMDSLGGSLGTGVSNSDVAFIKTTVPQLQYSREARTALLKKMDEIAQKKIAIYEEARGYAEEKGGLTGFRPGAGKNKDISKLSNEDLLKEIQ